MKKIVALVLAMVMVLGLATTAFAAKGGYTFGAAKNDTGWDYNVEIDDAEDAKDKTFATYEIEAVATKDGADKWFGAAVGGTAPVEEGDDFELGSYVLVANAHKANFVLIDGSVITYYEKVTTDKKWDAVAVKATLPALPLDDADKACNTLYSTMNGVPATVYVYDDALWVATTADATPTNLDESKATATFNVGGVVVYAREAKAGVDYIYNGHDIQVATSNVTHSVTGTPTVTKVYCDDCKAEFKFVQGPETAAVGVFGAGKYDEIGFMLYIEKIVPVNFPTGTVVAPADKDDDKVESPKTFDAGIAMYVGMSVMAAAGSAVVLKKKD